MASLPSVPQTALGTVDPDGTLTVDKIAQKMREILQLLGHDVDREGLRETPIRWAKFMVDFPDREPFNMTSFDRESYGGMVVQSNIPFFSLCEHHLLPFFGTASIGYIPNGKVVGLSKLSRVLDRVSRQPQNQERITEEVATFLMSSLNAKGVAVVLRARHLCMELRGVRKSDAYTTTSSVLGTFSSDLNARQEFLHLIRNP
jgi:GTP cyclohydrolase IA